jgi:AcrR family transcriptional regulator
MNIHSIASRGVRTRNPEAKREQLLSAALTEFAAHGLAGARVDRIAKRAQISPGLVYSFYDGKEELFDAVFDAIVATTIAGVPIDASDLGEYAAHLYDAAVKHPDAVRFLTWYSLARPRNDPRRSGRAAMKDKLDAIAEAQRIGTINDRFTPGQTLALVLALANMWHTIEEANALVPARARRATIIDAVRHLVS